MKSAVNSFLHPLYSDYKAEQSRYRPPHSCLLSQALNQRAELHPSPSPSPSHSSLVTKPFNLHSLCFTHTNMTPNTNDPPLDEIQWRSPQMLHQMGGLHSNTILFYFAESPFFERTSNNGTIMNQAMINPNMYHLIQTREAFEGRLRLMNGLEFIVGEEPAETGPGMGTGVWVIRKQTRRSQHDVAVHATYFVVGENIYMAPTLGNILASRIVNFIAPICPSTLMLIDDHLFRHSKSSSCGRKRKEMATISGSHL